MLDLSIALTNLASPPILFFALGLAAALVRSDLSIPAPVGKFLSIYLLMAIGFHGGVELAANGVSLGVAATLLTAIVTSFLIPFWSYALLRLRLDVANAAAVAACYGSISAVTFVTAVSFLDRAEIPFSGHMVAAMALMESPAIVAGVLLARLGGVRSGSGGSWATLFHEATVNGAVVLLMGSLTIGYITGDRGWSALAPFVKEPFQGLLCLFLLDMGLVAARQIGELRRSGPSLLGFGLIAPLVHAFLGIAAAHLLHLPPGDALLLAVLFGSASYIAVPAAMRMALPQANPGLYVPLSLAVTFPLNITVGIPLYMAVIQWSRG